MRIFQRFEKPQLEGCLCGHAYDILWEDGNVIAQLATSPDLSQVLHAWLWS